MPCVPWASHCSVYCAVSSQKAMLPTVCQPPSIQPSAGLISWAGVQAGATLLLPTCFSNSAQCGQDFRASVPERSTATVHFCGICSQLYLYLPLMDIGSNRQNLEQLTWFVSVLYRRSCGNKLLVVGQFLCLRQCSHTCNLLLHGFSTFCGGDHSVQ